MRRQRQRRLSYKSEHRKLIRAGQRHLDVPGTVGLDEVDLSRWLIRRTALIFATATPKFGAVIRDRERGAGVEALDRGIEVAHEGSTPEFPVGKNPEAELTLLCKRFRMASFSITDFARLTSTGLRAL